MANSTVSFPVKDSATKDAINAQFKQLQDKTGKTKTEVLTDLLIPRAINEAALATQEPEDPYAAWKDDARKYAQASVDLVERLCQRFEQREEAYHATHDSTVEDLMQQVARLTSERDAAEAERDAAVTERDEAKRQYEVLAKAVAQKKPTSKPTRRKPAKPRRQERPKEPEQQQEEPKDSETAGS